MAVHESAHENDCDEEFQSITRKLSQSTLWKHGVRPQLKAVMPTIYDLLQSRKSVAIDQKPIVAQAAQAQEKPPFNSLTSPFSRELGAPGFIQGLYLPPWEQTRCDQPLKVYEKRVRSASGERSRPWKASSHPREFRPATVDGCTTQVKEAVKDHMEQREKHLFPNFVAQKKLQRKRQEEEKRLAAQLLRRTNTLLQVSQTRDLMKVAYTKTRSRASSGAVTRPLDAPKPKKLRETTPHDLHGTALFKDVNRVGREFSVGNPWQLAMEDDACSTMLASKRSTTTSATRRTVSAGDLLVVL